MTPKHMAYCKTPTVFHVSSCLKVLGLQIQIHGYVPRCTVCLLKATAVSQLILTMRSISRSRSLFARVEHRAAGRWRNSYSVLRDIEHCHKIRP